MKIIVPLIRYYDLLFKSPAGEVIIKSFNENEKILFEAIRVNNELTDVHASKLLYDGNPSNQSYMKFKQGFYDKLIKIASNMEVAEVDLYLAKKLKLLKEWNVVRMLSNLSPTQLTKALEKKVLLKADRLHVFDICATVCQAIATDLKILEKKDREGGIYWEKYLRYKTLEENRIYAKNAYADVIKFTRKKHLNEKLSEEAKKSADLLLTKLSQENVPAFKFYYQLRYLQHILLGDHEKVIENNLKAIEYFKNHTKVIDAIGTLKVQVSISYFNLNQYNEALKYLDENISPLSKRWILNVSLRARAFLIKEEFAEASSYISRVTKHPAFREGRKVFQEQVWLFKYYSDLLVGLETGGEVNTRQVKNNLTRIRVDKKGMNIPLLFADIINEVLKKGTNYLYKELDRLDIYYKSHVKPSKNKRATLFLKFLILLPEHAFNKKNFRIKLKRIKEAFYKNPMKDVVQPDNEFVNYEVLVSSLLDRFVPQEENIFADFSKNTLKIEEALV